MANSEREKAWKERVAQWRANGNFLNEVRARVFNRQEGSNQVPVQMSGWLERQLLPRMRNCLSKNNLFNGRHFEQEMLILCVRWYLRYKVSYRDLAGMMAERGLSVAHTTISSRVQHYAPEFDKRWSCFSIQAGTS